MRTTKHSAVLMMMAVLCTACSVFSNPPQSRASATASETAAPSPALGERHLSTATPLPTETATETPIPFTRTPFPSVTVTLRPTITFPAPDLGHMPTGSPIFGTIQISGGLIQWGSCNGPHSITFTVRVSKTERLYYVLLFMRLQDKYSSLGTEWGGGAIMTGNKSVYSYTITTENITGFRDFDDAWLQYQIVASDSRLRHLGSSLVYRDDISITHCATPTPEP